MSLRELFSDKEIFSGPRMARRTFAIPDLPLGRLLVGKAVVRAKPATEEMLREREVHDGKRIILFRPFLMSSKVYVTKSLILKENRPQNKGSLPLHLQRLNFNSPNLPPLRNCIPARQCHITSSPSRASILR